MSFPPCFSATGDVAGIGWERTEGTPPPPGQPAKGQVYFTYCGQRLSPYLEDVSGGMWPVVHIQKKAGCLAGKENMLLSNLDAAPPRWGGRSAEFTH